MHFWTIYIDEIHEIQNLIYELLYIPCADVLQQNFLCSCINTVKYLLVLNSNVRPQLEDQSIMMLRWH